MIEPEKAAGLNTDDLIAALVERHRPVAPAWLERTSICVAALGAMMTALLIWSTMGFRDDLVTAAQSGRIAAKYLFLFISLVIAGHLFAELARPGRRLLDHAIVYGLPLVFVWLAALVQVSVLGAPTAAVVLGEQRNWLLCLVLVPILAIVPFMGCLYILRRSAPTDLTGAGFAAGVFAATISAVAYAAHCPCDMPVFVGLWYPLAFLTSGSMGAVIAPKLARW